MKRVWLSRLAEPSPLWQHQLDSRKCHRPPGPPKIPAPLERTLVTSWVLIENLPKQRRSGTISRTFACAAGAPSTNTICSVGLKINLLLPLVVQHLFLQAILPHQPLSKRFRNRCHHRETDERLNITCVCLGSHGYPAHCFSNFIHFPSCNSNFPVQNVLLGFSSTSWHP